MSKGNGLFQSIYQFSAKDINGNTVSFDKYKGFVLLIANVASLCGYTSAAYNAFKELSDRYHDKGLRILLFPCNQFLRQEPGTGKEIEDKVCAIGGRFDLFDKINVNGSETHPLFAYLKKECPGTLVNAIKWNFTKFLVDRTGRPIKRFGPDENNVDKLASEIQTLLDGSEGKPSASGFSCDEM